VERDVTPLSTDVNEGETNGTGSARRQMAISHDGIVARNATFDTDGKGLSRIRTPR
jgi:hypothetical protein